MEKILLIFLVSYMSGCWTYPQVSSAKSLVVSSTEGITESVYGDSDDVTKEKEISLPPKIYEMDIKSNVSNRYAKTFVSSKVKNFEKTSGEATFSVVLPETAFISEFVMTIDGKSYKAYVKEKGEAKEIYDKAVASGQAAAHVAINARDSNRFTVSVNVEPESKATFLLTYEELLQRKNDQYELVLNIHPGQVVKDLNVEVFISESKPIKFVRTAPLRSGNEIRKNDPNLNPSSDIININGTLAIVKFKPDELKQKEFAKLLKSEEENGLNGQFVVQYEVERDSNGGEVLLRDGYFVHFFAPNDLHELPKQVVFILDTSGSMGGEKITQLQDAMEKILSSLNKDDLFNIVEFNSYVTVKNIDKESSVKLEPIEDYTNPFPALSEIQFPPAAEASEKNITKATGLVKALDAGGSTNMIGGLEVGLYLVKQFLDDEKFTNQPMIIFLTDGSPNVGMSNQDEIIKTITDLNTFKVPIFSLSFGYGANKDFLRKLSLRNQGFARHIYEGVDASIQLQEFYKQISSPLLSNVTFKYDADSEATRRKFPIHFSGSELVVSGRYETPDISKFESTVEGIGPNGKVSLRPMIDVAVGSLERIWAYINVKQILEERKKVDNKTDLTNKALDLALKYSFVTDVSSLVVVKPNETTSVDTEDASASHGYRWRGRSRARTKSRVSLYGSSGPRLGSSFAGEATSGIPTPLQFPRSNEPTITNYPTIELPWLKTVLDQNGGKIIVPQGEFVMVNIDYADIGSIVECTNNPVNSTTPGGNCRYIKDCPEVYQYLTNLDEYLKYFCHIREYAGVCCPKRMDPPVFLG